MIWILFFIIWSLVFIFIMLMSMAPAGAHTRTELDEWVEWWSVQADYAIDPGLLEMLTDMAERHPWYFDEDASGGTVQASASTSGIHRGMGSDVAPWRGLVEAYFDPGDIETAMCIMSHESGGNPNAKNPKSTAAGLFQFLRGTWDNMVPASVSGGSYASGQVYNGEANIRSAAWLQNAAGWTQWSPYNRGECRGLS